MPEEIAPVQPIGRLTLTHNPTNFFAEVEQVAFHLGNLVPGIDVTDDPLLQARLFSYVDTQLSRLGGPNYNQIPVNRPHAPVNDMFRDGFHQHAVHEGVAPYKPNTLDGGCPFHAGITDEAFADLPVTVPAASKVRENPASYDDHFSQVRLFWKSMTPVEQEHIINAYAFELGKCYEQAVKERQLLALANIDAELCSEVAAALGLPIPKPTVEYDEPEASPALSQLGETWPTDGRMIGIVVGTPGEVEAVESVRRDVLAAGMVPLVIGPHGGDLGSGLVAQRTYATARSVEFDAILVASAAPPAADAMMARDAEAGTPGVVTDPRVLLLLQECFRHCKAVGSWGNGNAVVAESGCSGTGVAQEESAVEALAAVQELLGAHRVWERFSPTA